MPLPGPLRTTPARHLHYLPPTFRPSPARGSRGRAADVLGILFYTQREDQVLGTDRTRRRPWLDAVATGHYARLEGGQSRRPAIFQAAVFGEPSLIGLAPAIPAAMVS